jgi:hypothetical protein
MREQHERLHSSIQGDINALVDVFNKCNPLELLSYLSFQYLLKQQEAEGDFDKIPPEIYFEYALSIATSIPTPINETHATQEQLDVMRMLIPKIIEELQQYYLTEGVDKEDTNEAFMRFRALQQFIILRGDSYPQHHLDLITNLAEPHSSFLSNKYGFSSDEFVKGVVNIERQHIEWLKRYIDSIHTIKESHEVFLSHFCPEGTPKQDDFPTPESVIALMENAGLTANINKAGELFQEIPFSITPDNLITEPLLKALSCSFGQNSNFLDFEKSPGWPANDSIVYVNPLIEYKSKYYCFSYILLYRNIKKILEYLIKKVDKEYYQRIYQKSRGNYLEQCSLFYLQNLLPGAEVYGKLYYDYASSANEDNKRPETDGIIIIDGKLIILEAKANVQTLSSRRGSISRTKTDLKAILGKAYSQGKRVLQYIDNTANPVFADEKGNLVLSIQKNQIKERFIVNVTLENLQWLATDLNSTKKLGVLDGAFWPWSVFVNDLRVISEMGLSICEFVLYLKRRLRINDFEQFDVCDEMDFLMLYLREGLYYENDDIKRYHHLCFTGYTDDLDAYFMHKAGQGPEAIKPTTYSNKMIKHLVGEIERAHQPGFIDVGVSLLAMSGDSQSKFASALNRAFEMNEKDGKPHDISLAFADYGLTAFISSSLFKEPKRKEAISHCELKKYQLKLDVWHALFIARSTSGEITVDHVTIDVPWRYNAEMESKLKHYQKRTLTRTKESDKKIGRNSPCPCNSGKKYKKCCGRG